MSAQEIAEAILLVIRRIAKWLAFGLLGVIALGLAVWGAVRTYRYFDYDRPKSEVQLVVKRDKDFCSSEFPVFVGVVNKSQRTILRYSFKFEVNEKGHSTNIASWDSNEDDKIIKPGEGWGICWRVKHKDSTYSNTVWITDPNVDIRVTHFNPTFK